MRPERAQISSTVSKIPKSVDVSAVYPSRASSQASKPFIKSYPKSSFSTYWQYATASLWPMSTRVGV